MSTITAIKQRQILNDEIGSVAAIFAFLLFVFCGVAALTIDVGRGTVQRNSLQTAADAAALAGAIELPNQDGVRDAVMATLRHELPDLDLDRLLDPADIRIGIWDRESREFQDGGVFPNAVRVRLARSTDRGNAMDTYFAATVFGSDDLDISAEAVAAKRGGNTLELALVLDVSYSMREELDSLRTAALGLVDELFDNYHDWENLAVSIVPFTGGVNLGNSRGRRWIHYDPEFDEFGRRLPEPPERTCPEERAGSLAFSDAPPSSQFAVIDAADMVSPFSCPATDPIVELTGVEARIRRAISGLTQWALGTSSELGMAWGWRTLSPLWRGYWGAGHYPLPYSDQTGFRKAVLIMTDGRNNPHYIDRPGRYSSATPYDEFGANQRLLQVCDAMKAEEIVIYTMVLDSDPTLQDLYEQCSTHGATANFSALNRENLVQGMQEFAGAIPPIAVLVN